MAKNEQGQIECINNKDHKMKKGETSYLVPSYNPNPVEGEPVVIKIDENRLRGFAFDIHYCTECGYIELYDAKD